MIWCNKLKHFCMPMGKISLQLPLILTKHWWKTSCSIKVLLRYVHNIAKTAGITTFSDHIWFESVIIIDLPACPGCFIGISFNEANSFCTAYGEALTLWSKLWLCSEILCSYSRRLYHTSFSTGEHGTHKSPRRGVLAQRFWSCTFLFKASVPAQNTCRDITNSTKACLNSIVAGMWVAALCSRNLPWSCACICCCSLIVAVMYIWGVPLASSSPGAEIEFCDCWVNF